MNRRIGAGTQSWTDLPSLRFFRMRLEDTNENREGRVMNETLSL